MKYTNRGSVGEGSFQSARVHRLAKALVDQVWSDKKQQHVHSLAKSKHVTDISKFNWSIKF